MKWFTETSKALTRGLGELLPGCRQVTRFQSEAMDHKLRLSQRIGLRLHLAVCKWCRRYGAQIRFLHGASRRQPDHLESVPRNLPDDARERIRRKLQAAQDGR